MPGGTNVTPSSAYVAPTAAGTKLGNFNIARFEEIVHQGLNDGDLSVIDTHVSPTVVDHQFYGPGYPRSRGGIKALTAALRTGFPDLHAVPTTLVASNNGTQTFAIIRTTGTNTGRYLGVPPSGRKVVINIVESALWKDGVMVEHWGVVDNIGLLAQMGLFPLDQFPSFDVKKLAKQYQQQLADPPTLHYRTATTPQAKLAAATRLTRTGSTRVTCSPTRSSWPQLLRPRVLRAGVSGERRRRAQDGHRRQPHRPPEPAYDDSRTAGDRPAGLRHPGGRGHQRRAVPPGYRRPAGRSTSACSSTGTSTRKARSTCTTASPTSSPSSPRWASCPQFRAGLQPEQGRPEVPAGVEKGLEVEG